MLHAAADQTERESFRVESGEDLRAGRLGSHASQLGHDVVGRNGESCRRVGIALDDPDPAIVMDHASLLP